MPQPPIYDPEAVKPMEVELNRVGVDSLRTPGDVDALLAKEGTALVVINSVCGCAAGGARPGVMLSLQNGKIPGSLGTVFAGVDRDAVDHARSKMPEVMPSSPCIAVFKGGQPVHVLERRHIETMDARMIALFFASDADPHASVRFASCPR